MSTEKNCITLSEEQQLFISKALDGHNILVDACIGSGKTTAIQMLCNAIPPEYNILYLTYNRLLKIDAKSKIRANNATVTNYHGFAYSYLIKEGISVGISDLIQTFNKTRPQISKYDVLILDEYQDIELELAEMLKFIKVSCPDIQIIAVGDMEQKIYDKTTLDVPSFIDDFLGDYIQLEFTKCFRLSPTLAEKLGRIWGKTIIGVNENCTVEEMSKTQVVDFLAEQKPQDILCLGARTGDMADSLNELEYRYPDRFNKKTVYASIREADTGGATEPRKTSAIFTTYDSSKGLERPVCVIFDYTESYWETRITQPQQSYQILRNIFCVAASRGKQHIIFVHNNEAMLSEETISTPVGTSVDFSDVDISHMFDFKYKEDIEKCYNFLKISPTILSEDGHEINIKNNDGLIDLSPCIGTYQEAIYFSQYDIDKDIDFCMELNNVQGAKTDENIRSETLDKKILYLTSLETKQNRYKTQVDTPFVSDVERDSLCQRLSSKFSEEETVQVECKLPFADNVGENLLFTAKGRADVVKDNIVYELKFVSALTHEHFLQCACYVVAMELDIGIIWNTRKNQAYEIRVPNRKAFLDAVARTITKGYLREYKNVGSITALDASAHETTFAVIDTETNFQNEVMSIGVIIADAATYETIDSEYYIISPECSVGGMFSSSLYLVGSNQIKKCSRSAALSDLLKVLNAHGAHSIYAYNASFDRNHLPELHSFVWYDIMKLAAYKQYNHTISDKMNCTATGKLKAGYGVEPTLQRLLGDCNYQETHNALFDARDELKIMELLGQPLKTYHEVASVNVKSKTSQSSYKAKFAPQPTQDTVYSESVDRTCWTMDELLGQPPKTYHKVASANVKSKTSQSGYKAKFAPQPTQDTVYSESVDRTYWTMDELTYRYNVSRHKISNDFMSRGLPYYKEGRSYRFPINDVKKWEIKTKWISYGREAEMIELPAYSEYCQYLSDELSKAKRNKDKSRIDEIKSLAQQSEIRLDNHSFPEWLAFFILIIWAFVAYWCILKY